MRLLTLTVILLMSSRAMGSGQSTGRKKVYKYDFTAKDLDECRAAMQHYSRKLASYHNCTLANLHPSSMCVNCRKLFLETEDAFSNLDAVVSSKRNVTCKELYITNSGLPLDSKFIQSSFDDSFLGSGRFLRAQCHKCFLNNDIAHGNLTQGLEEVLQAYDKLTDCYDRYFQNEIKEHAHGPKHPLCKSCDDLFHQFMDTYHVKMANNDTSKQILGQMCLDVIDRVLLANEVYDQFHCRFTYPVDKRVLVAAAITMLIPMLFYIPFVYKCLTEEDVKQEGIVHTSLTHFPIREGQLYLSEKNGLPAEADSSNSEEDG